MARRRYVLIGAALAALFMLALVDIAAAYRPTAWGCFQRQADGQCVVTVGIDKSFAPVDQRVIREVLGNFSESPNIEVAEVSSKGAADVFVNQGCLSGRRCGFFTDMQTRQVYIDPYWSYATYCCDQHDGMRGVYCHELMHAIGGESDLAVRLEPSCFNGTSPYLGPEDFAEIAAQYPLGG